MSAPKVSVVMTVYNAEKYLAEAIESILNQTYSDFEFIIIDDGSTDRSLEIIKSYADGRIITRSRRNKGVVASSNEGISMAKGKYIARQDADDVSDKTRFEKQIKFLDDNPSIEMVGTNYRAIDADGKKLFETDMFTRPDDLHLAIIFTNQFGHGSTMMRSSAFKKVGAHAGDTPLVHDYDLWMRLAHVGRMANLKEVLYIWRYLSDSHSNKKFAVMQEQIKHIRDREFKLFRENRNAYRFWSCHPLSARGGPVKYMEHKSLIYRDMALMYCYAGYRRKAILPLLYAALFSFWSAKNYRYFLTVAFKKQTINQLQYE